jgi:hypothetical protein
LAWAANEEQSFRLFTLARWVCIPFSLLGGYICLRWARELYGKTAGVLALALWCFCPNIIAHGQLITADAAATALAVAACYTFWRWLRQPTWWHTPLSGVVLGVAELAKTTLVIFYPLWPILWVIYRWPEWRRLPLTPNPSPARGEGRLGHADGTSRRAGMPATILHELGMLVVRMIIGIYVINLGYGFEGTGTQLGDFRFVSASLGAEGDAESAPASGGNRFADSWLATVPVLLPKNYVLGIDLQRRDFEHYGRPSYLGGEFRNKGWWYYYLYALAIKVPLGTWVLIGLATTRGIWWRQHSRHAPRAAAETNPKSEFLNSKQIRISESQFSKQGSEITSGNGTRSVLAASNLRPATLADGTSRRAGMPATWRDEFILLAPAVVIRAFVSSQTGFSEHMRYVLPIFPFVFVWIGRVAVVFDQKRRILSGLAAAALAWSIGSSLWVYPHSLSYFNELVGGPTGGPNHLIHSNVDWGQDLLKLKHWLDKHPEARPLKLAYFGYFDPKYVGIEYTAPELPLTDGELKRGGQASRYIGKPVPEIPPGWYAISVNFIRGLPWSAYKGDGTKTSFGQNKLVKFQKLKPVAMAGYSIYIYHVPDDKPVDPK